MTNQEEMQSLFNVAIQHVRKQGKPSGDEKGGRFICAYRADDGLQCAAAPFIRDYSTTMEGSNFSSLATAPHFRRFLDPLALKHNVLIAEIQFCHDAPAGAYAEDFLQEFEDGMAMVAARYGLEVPQRELL